MSYVDPESRRPTIEKVVKVGVVAVICAATATIAVNAVIGLAGWVVFGGLAILAVNLAPAFSRWVANLGIVALKRAIARNPIETMQNIRIGKAKELRTAETAITDFETELGNYRDQVEVFQRKYPAKASMYAAILAKQEEQLKGMRADQRHATQALAAYDDKIAEMTATWNMAKSANKMLEKSKSARSEMFDKMSEDFSVETVNRELNKSFANLNTAIERRQTAESLEAAQSEPLALGPVPEVMDITQHVSHPVRVSGSVGSGRL